MIDFLIICGNLFFSFILFCAIVVVVTIGLTDLYNFLHRKIVTRRRMATLTSLSVGQWLDISPTRLISNCERENMITCRWPVTQPSNRILTLTVEVEEIDFGYDIDYLLIVMGDGNAFAETSMLSMHVSVDELPNLQDALRIISL